jgi:hypothetical protein
MPTAKDEEAAPLDEPVTLTEAVDVTKGAKKTPLSQQITREMPVIKKGTDDE